VVVHCRARRALQAALRPTHAPSALMRCACIGACMH
jgi:hypothetical protein